MEVGVRQYTPSEQSQWERELLGLYLSGHPLKDHEEMLERHTNAITSIKSEHDGRPVTVGGVVTDIREITTKNGQKMAFIKITDVGGEVELLLFPGVYEKTSEVWQRDKVVIAKGKVTTRDKNGTSSGDIKILVSSADEAAQYKSSGPKSVSLSSSEGAGLSPFMGPTTKRVYIRLVVGP